MTTREWHELVKPVIPHALKDSDFPELSHIRIELGDKALYAVASDRYTLGAERRVLDAADRHQAMPPVHCRASDVAASLKLFGFSKDDDPALTVTIDSVSVPAEIIGQAGLYSSLGITLTSADGGRLVMHDRRVPDRDHLARWRLLLRTAMVREQAAVLDGLALGAAYVGRWQHAVRAGELMRLYSGPKDSSPLLVVVERHFAGLWIPVSHIEARSVRSLAWLDELGYAADPGTGEVLDEDGDDR